MIKEEFIQLNIEVTDWEEAIRQSATPLLTGKKLQQSILKKLLRFQGLLAPIL